LKTGYCLTGHYLAWAECRPTAKCWWCPYRTQTTEHVLKFCPHWERQRAVLWAVVRTETGWGKDPIKVRNLVADEQCGAAARQLRTSSAPRKSGGESQTQLPIEGPQSEVSDWELRKWEDRAEVSPTPTSWFRRRRSKAAIS